MSDAALVGSQGPASDSRKKSTEGYKENHGTHVAPTIQSEPVKISPDGTTSRVTTSGNVVRSNDPTTHPDASVGQKLKGDLQGAIHGTIGSLQATAGVVTRNEKLEQKGLDKMAEEDARLGSKQGVMPVGSELREGKE